VHVFLVTGLRSHNWVRTCAVS